MKRAQNHRGIFSLFKLMKHFNGTLRGLKKEGKQRSLSRVQSGFFLLLFELHLNQDFLIIYTQQSHEKHRLEAFEKYYV